MRYHRLLVVVSFLTASLFTTPRTFAQSNTPASQSSATPANSSSANASESGLKSQAVNLDDIDFNSLRLSLIDGVVSYANSAARARFELYWDYLPDDQTLTEARRIYAASEPIIITLSNESLKDEETWIEEVKEQGHADKLIEALKVQSLEGLDTFSSQGFEDYWTKKGQPGRELMSTTNASLLFGVLRDYNALVSLLRSDGISYSVDLTPAPRSGNFPIVSEENITWQIKLYRFVVNDVVFYRHAIRANFEPIEVTFPGESGKNTEVNLATKVSFIGSENTIGIFEPILSANPISVKLEDSIPPNVKTLFKDASENTAASLDSVFKFFGGQGLGTLINTGLLAGNDNTSTFFGGLITDNTVDPVVGANFEFSPLESTSFGAALGVGTNDGGSLFLGPSLRTSTFTLGLGVQVSSQDDVIDVDPAGVLSFDLSRLVGNRSTIKEITVDNSTSGGNWGKVSSEIAQNITLIELSLDNPKNVQLEGEMGFTLVKIKEVDGTEIDASGPRSRIPISLLDLQEENLKIMPRGIYKYEEINLPTGFELDGVLDGLEVPLNEDPSSSAATPLEYELVPISTN
ncbi:MAG: hypothetical protein AAGF93_00270 [Cyanobacteria bacterium P01_H01_bin.105]